MFPTPGAPMLGAKATPKLLRAYRQLGARGGDDDGSADAATDAGAAAGDDGGVVPRD